MAQSTTSDGDKLPHGIDQSSVGNSQSHAPACLPVAIVGMGFRLPGDLGNESEFWTALKAGRDLVTEVPADRWATDELQHGTRAEPGRSITFAAGVRTSSMRNSSAYRRARRPGWIRSSVCCWS
ncbi:beta-ketoacyl synthase N-terminal-like domain-containing protein [Herbaspirillum frisingense]|uniref:Beta-ketoacyl synthase-like N-terminal domain-containing protein n=1 Tax=Herbaspirillum frisingense TaxID=92645 RepID=A0ABU1PGM1_9BURK|nr:beta-ketoacyl synthase N-terminal-like domain-containing protein [Herbaspirillum frisingense]MDR6585101.1 hypothetical protein [Herbaspirillum frisingense]